MRIFLAGVSCVGKTTVGAKLATLLGCPFFDLDHEIQRFFSMPIEHLQAKCLTMYAFRQEAGLMEMSNFREICSVHRVPVFIPLLVLQEERSGDCGASSRGLFLSLFPTLVGADSDGPGPRKSL